MKEGRDGIEVQVQVQGNNVKATCITVCCCLSAATSEEKGSKEERDAQHGCERQVRLIDRYL